jgi:phosphoribosyl-AMP cyclohydrolase
MSFFYFRSSMTTTALEIDFAKGDGLVPAIIQEAEDGQVLMLGYLNEEAWLKTLETGRVWFYSRSKNRLWMKGESSGHEQEVVASFLDCDSDTLLIQVRQRGGAACHTGHRSCFYRQWQKDSWQEISAPIVDPATLYGPKGSRS